MVPTYGNKRPSASLLQISLERERVAELQGQVAAMQERVAEQRKKMGGINAAQEGDLQV